MNSRPFIDRLRSRNRANSLDQDFYVGSEVYRAELDALWYRDWIFVASTAQVSTVGAYVTLAIGDYQIVIIRGDDGAVRALHNVCRHRGSIVCTEPSGTARRLICPYHQWAYDLEGQLVNARRADDVDKSELGMTPVACEVVGGMIFVSLAQEPPDFEPMRKLASSYLAPFDLDTAQVAHSETIVEKGNWKLVMENNRECFHCLVGHPELSATYPEAPVHVGGGSEAERLAMEQMVALGESLGLPSKFAIADDQQFRFMRQPLIGDARSMTTDGTPAVSRRFGNLPQENLGDVLLYHYPSTWDHFMSDHAVTFRLLPLSPTRTQLTTTWLVPEGAVAGVDYELGKLTEVWQSTNAQDATFVERNQRGVNSPAYRPGPYNTDHETGVVQFIDWYADRMIAHHDSRL